MFFLEDSDEEYASPASNQEDVLSLRADRQRVARRNLSTAVLFAHRHALSKTLAALSRHIIHTREKNSAGAREANAKRLPIWRQGEFFQKQRHRRLLHALHALQDNTGKHKAATALQHFAGRTRAVVFGALVAYVREQRALSLQEQRRALVFSRSYRPQSALRFWRQSAWMTAFLRCGVQVADTLNVLVLMRRGVAALHAHLLLRRLARHRRGRCDVLISNRNASAVRRVLHAWHARMSTRISLSQRMLQRRGCLEAARRALHVLYANLPLPSENDAGSSVASKKQAQGVVKSLHMRHLLRRGLRALWSRLALRRAEAGRACKLSPLCHRVREGVIYLSVSRTRLGFREQLRRRQSFRRLRLHAENARLNKELIRAANLHEIRLASGSVFHRLASLRSDAARTRRAIVQRDAFAAGNALRRALAQWLHYLNAQLVQHSSLSVARDHTTPYSDSAPFGSVQSQRVTFNKKSRAVASWMAVALNRRRVEARRQRVAQAGYETYTCRAALLRLRCCCRASAARRRGTLLAQFSRSSRQTGRAVAEMLRRANISPYALGRSGSTNICSKRLEMDRCFQGLLFWKLWRSACGLQRWKVYLNARRKKRYEWVQSQQAHRADLCALGVRLWVAAAGDKQAHRVNAQANNTLRSAWRRWKWTSQQQRLRRGISPSVISSFSVGCGGHQSYVHINPMLNSLAPLPDAARGGITNAAATAARYAPKLRQSGLADVAPASKVMETATAAAAAAQSVRDEARRLHSALEPASAPPLHRAPPRTNLYDQEVQWNMNGDTGNAQKRPCSWNSPVSVTHAAANSPDAYANANANASPDSSRRRHHEHSFGGTSTAEEAAATNAAALIALRKKSARIAIAHEIIGLVTELKGKLL